MSWVSRRTAGVVSCLGGLYFWPLQWHSVAFSTSAPTPYSSMLITRAWHLLEMSQKRVVARNFEQEPGRASNETVCW